MFSFLGRGWKTITGAILWSVAHAGLVTATVGLVAPTQADRISTIVANIGGALAALGLAHKAERLDTTT